MGSITSAGTGWEDLAHRGIREREQGSVKTAVKLLNDALEIAPEQEDRMFILNHLGLAYFHDGDYTSAVDKWNKVLTVSNVQGDPFLNAKAVALRNLSRKELCETEKDYKEAVSKANEAREMAKELKRPDLPWFTHGLFSANYAYMKILKNVDMGVLKKLVGSEKEELKKVWKTAPKLERNVWLGALLMDYAVVYDKVSKPLLKIARFFSRAVKLRRREEQITKLINEIG
jgi:tetratricopeptide (TPR) repeat protein